MSDTYSNTEGFTKAQEAEAFWFIEKVRTKAYQVRSDTYPSNFWPSSYLDTTIIAFRNGKISLKELVEIANRVNEDLDRNQI